MVRLFLQVFWLGCVGLNAYAQPLQLTTEENRPYSYRDAGQLRGMAVDVVRELARRTGEQIEIDVQPWTRSYQKVRRGESLVLFPVVRTAERERLFHWVGPITASRASVYTRASSDLRLHGVADVRSFAAVALPRQWYSYERLRSLGLENLYGVNSPQTMMRMFSRGRVEVLISERIGLAALLAEQGMQPSQVRWQFDLMPSVSYIAFSRAFEPRRVALWQSRLSSMRRDGQLEAINRQWFGDLLSDERAALLESQPMNERVAKMPAL